MKRAKHQLKVNFITFNLYWVMCKILFFRHCPKKSKDSKTKKIQKINKNNQIIKTIN